MNFYVFTWIFVVFYFVFLGVMLSIAGRKGWFRDEPEDMDRRHWATFGNIPHDEQVKK